MPDPDSQDTLNDHAALGWRAVTEIGYYLIEDPTQPVTSTWDGELCDPGDPMVLDHPNTKLVDSYRSKDGIVPRVGEYVTVGEPPWEPGTGQRTPDPVFGRVVGVVHHILPIKDVEWARERNVSVFLVRADPAEPLPFAHVPASATPTAARLTDDTVP